MDRLVCGDVGFGKTEVSVRAAFKAALAGKQTMMLAPTTILVQQHERTFKERLGSYAVRVESLSRFTSPADGAGSCADFAGRGGGRARRDARAAWVGDQAQETSGSSWWTRSSASASGTRSASRSTRPPWTSSR